MRAVTATHTWREIHEQPAVLERFLQASGREVRALGTLLRRRRFRAVVFAARGSSDNAALYGKYLVEAVLGLPVALAAPSIVTLYRRVPDVRGLLVVALSQSGKSTDITEYVRAARRAGALTVGVTNDPRSPLAVVAEHVILLHAGSERSVAATKTYLAQLAALAFLVGVWSGHRGMSSAVPLLPGAVAQALEVEAAVEAAAPRYRAMAGCLVTARGFNYATAYEAALKLKETCYVVAEALSGADLLHGPVAVVERGFPVILFAIRGRTGPFMTQVARRLARHGADLLVIGDEPGALRRATVSLALPLSGRIPGMRGRASTMRSPIREMRSPIPETLSPIPAIVPAQLLACHLSVARGLDPDRPRGLGKVTRTR